MTERAPISSVADRITHTAASSLSAEPMTIVKLRIYLAELMIFSKKFPRARTENSWRVNERRMTLTGKVIVHTAHYSGGWHMRICRATIRRSTERISGMSGPKQQLIVLRFL